MAKFTDNQLAKLFLQLTSDYNTLVNEGRPFEAIRDELTRRVLFALNNQASNLYWLRLADPDDQAACQREADKVMHALYTFMSTRPAFAHVDQPQAFFAQPQFVQINVDVHHDYANYRHQDYHCYCASNDFLFNWYLYRSLMRPQVIVVDNSSALNHGHSGKGDKKNGDWIAYLFFAALAAFLVVLALVALYYMLGQALNSIERIRFNEDWLQGMWTMAGTLAAGYVSYFLSMTFAASPLMNLALVAGLSSPVGAVVLSLACLTIIGAGVGCFITDQVQSYIAQKTNPDAMDPKDPSRFTLTPEEEYNLIQQGFDLMRVKYAIFTLWAELDEPAVPTWVHSRFFGESGKKVQENLNLIRKIRAGDLGENFGEPVRTVALRQGGETINFDMAPLGYYPAPVYAVYQQQQAYEPYAQQAFG